MKNNYTLQPTHHFDAQFKRYKKSLPRTKIERIFFVLSTNPFDVSLKTHKVLSRISGVAYSSSVTGDIRIIWHIDKPNSALILLDIGTHSGSHKIYK